MESGFRVLGFGFAFGLGVQGIGFNCGVWQVRFGLSDPGVRGLGLKAD